MVYTSYNRGFKSGGFNVAAPTDPAFKPEKLDAYEIGLKSDLFDRRLRLNTSAFYYDYTNLQVIKYTGTVTTIYNGASARVYGLDADVEARLNSNFSLSGGLTLLHDRFTDFPAAVIATQVPGGVITTVAPVHTEFLGSLDGRVASHAKNSSVKMGWMRLCISTKYTP